MRQALFYILTITFLITSNSCKKEKASTLSQAEIRVLNATPWKFYDCYIDPTQTLSTSLTSNAHNYGDIEVDSTSDYYTFPLLDVYRYSWARLNMNSQLYYLLPYDYIGETALPKGKYTYKITYLQNFDRLQLELIED